MNPNLSDTAQRMVACMVADESVTDRLPTALRSLQIGLIDELVDLLLVVPDEDRCRQLATGPTQIITYKPHLWPLAGLAHKRIAAQVLEKAQSLKPATPILVHSFSPRTAPLAAEIAAATEGSLLISLWSASEISSVTSLSSAGGPATMIAPSEVLAAAIRQRLRTDHRIDVIPLGAPAAPAPSAFRDPDRAATLVIAGALQEDQGIEAVLRTAKIAVQRHPNLLVFVIGRGPGEPALRRVAEDLEIDQQVIFTGRLEYLRSALEAADIFCLPSAAAPHREELIHAMAAGLAILAPQRSPYDHLVNEENALLFSEDDEQTLSTCLLRLLDNPSTARRLAAEAQAAARQHLSVPVMVEGHARIYRRLDRRERTFTLAQSEKS